MWTRTGRSLAVLLSLSFGPSLFAQDTAVTIVYPKEIRKSANTIAKIERFIDGRGTFDWLKIPEALGTARTDAEQYLETHPDDLGALMLLAQVSHIEAMFAPTTLSTQGGAWVGDTTDHLAPVHAALDRLLELEPRLAEAYYRKARLLATSNPKFEGDSLVITVDWQGCLSNAERAVDLDPQEPRYRELLAIARAEQGDLAGAADAVRELDGGKNLVYLLLTDFQAVPVPDDRIPLPRAKSTFVEMYGQAGLGGYANLRVRAFAVAGGKERVEDFYRAVWPDFTLFLQNEDESSKTYAQFLRATRAGFTPATTSAAVEADMPDDGIMLLVMELAGLTDAALLTYPDDPRLRLTFTQVVMVDFRRN